MNIVSYAYIVLDYFPKRWKNARIVVIFMPYNSPSHQNSYRSVSFLDVHRKLFAKTFKDKATKFINSLLIRSTKSPSLSIIVITPIRRYLIKIRLSRSLVCWRSRSNCLLFKCSIHFVTHRFLFLNGTDKVGIMKDLLSYLVLFCTLEISVPPPAHVITIVK